MDSVNRALISLTIAGCIDKRFDVEDIKWNDLALYLRCLTLDYVKGVIPWNTFTTMTMLRIFHMRTQTQNFIDYPLPESLKSLVLNDVRLVDVSLVALSCLKNLVVENCWISNEFIEQLNNLASLEELALIQCQSSTPLRSLNHSGLQLLMIDQLKEPRLGFFSSLELPSLKTLRLEHHHWVSMPASLATLSHIQELILIDNDLTNDEWRAFKGVKKLGLHQSKHLPTNLYQFTLEELDLTDNPSLSTKAGLWPKGLQKLVLYKTPIKKQGSKFVDGKGNELPENFFPKDCSVQADRKTIRSSYSAPKKHMPLLSGLSVSIISSQDAPCQFPFTAWNAIKNDLRAASLDNLESGRPLVFSSRALSQLEIKNCKFDITYLNKNIQYLQLSGVDLSKLPKNPLPYLQRLAITDCDSWQNLFVDLRALQTLSIKQAKLPPIPQIKLDRLEYLCLSSLSIQDTGEPTVADQDTGEPTVADAFAQCRMPCLRRLIIEQNNIHSVLSFVCAQEQLTHLALRNTSLKTLPREIGKLKKLTALDLSENDLDTTQKVIWPPSLKELCLVNSSIFFMPEGFCTSTGTQIEKHWLPPVQVFATALGQGAL